MISHLKLYLSVALCLFGTTYPIHGQTLEELLQRAAQDGERIAAQRLSQNINTEAQNWEAEERARRQKLEAEFAQELADLDAAHFRENTLRNRGRMNFVPSMPSQPIPGANRYENGTARVGQHAQTQYQIGNSQTQANDRGSVARIQSADSVKNQCLGTVISNHEIVTGRHCLSAGDGPVELVGTNHRSVDQYVHPDRTLTFKEVDLAVVKFNVDLGRPPVTIGKALHDNLGFYRTWRGHGFQDEKLGIVGHMSSLKTDEITHYITPRTSQTTGESGAPLINSAGELIGVLNGCDSDQCFYFAVLSLKGYDVLQSAEKDLGKFFKYGRSASR